MSQLTSLLVLVLVVATEIHSSQALFDCFLCSSSISHENVETVVTGTLGCRAGTHGDKTTAATYQSCFVTYTYDANGVRTIIRGTDNSTVDDPYCTSSDSKSTCYCNSASCNNDAVAIPTSLKCYECDSVEFFDNGCGETVKGTSKFVTEVTQCSACTKTVTILPRSDGFVKRYSRGCLRAVNAYEGCYGASTDRDEGTCTCDKDLCNSAQSLTHVAQWSFFIAVMSALRLAF